MLANLSAVNGSNDTAANVTDFLFAEPVSLRLLRVTVVWDEWAAIEAGGFDIRLDMLGCQSMNSLMVDWTVGSDYGLLLQGPDHLLGWGRNDHCQLATGTCGA